MELDVSWGKWQELLRTGLNAAGFVGLSEDRIEDVAYHLGDLFAKHIEAGNREQRLLQELWMEGTEAERRGLTSMLLKLLDQYDKQIYS